MIQLKVEVILEIFFIRKMFKKLFFLHLFVFVASSTFFVTNSSTLLPVTVLAYDAASK